MRPWSSSLQRLIVPGTFGNGIALIGKNLETSFHMSNASLGAVAFIAQVSQLLWAVPLARVGRPWQPEEGGGHRPAGLCRPLAA